MAVAVGRSVKVLAPMHVTSSGGEHLWIGRLNPRPVQEPEGWRMWDIIAGAFPLRTLPPSTSLVSFLVGSNLLTEVTTVTLSLVGQAGSWQQANASLAPIAHRGSHPHNRFEFGGEISAAMENKSRGAVFRVTFKLNVSPSYSLFV
jgi:hypothetical protein